MIQAVEALGVQIADWKTFYETAQRELTEAVERHRKLGEDWNAVATRQAETIDGLRERLEAFIKRVEELQDENAALKRPGSAPSDKGDITTRERQSLLKLALGMAIKKYRYDPIATKNSATKHIADDLRELSLSLEEDTIRKYLNEGKELLGDIS